MVLELLKRHVPITNVDTLLSMALDQPDWEFLKCLVETHHVIDVGAIVPVSEPHEQCNNICTENKHGAKNAMNSTCI